MIQGESVGAAEQFGEATIDWVFIDALHDYRSVVADIRAWAPKMRHGGLISGHDWGRDGVTDAALRFFTLDEISVEHSIWMTRATPRLRAGRAMKNQVKRLIGRG